MLNLKSLIKAKLDNIASGLPCTVYDSNEDAIANSGKTVSATGVLALGDWVSTREIRAIGFDILINRYSILYFIKSTTERAGSYTRIETVADTLRNSITGALSSQLVDTYQEVAITNMVGYVELIIEIKELA